MWSKPAHYSQSREVTGLSVWQKPAFTNFQGPQLNYSCFHRLSRPWKWLIIFTNLSKTIGYNCNNTFRTSVIIAWFSRTDENVCYIVFFRTFYVFAPRTDAFLWQLDLSKIQCSWQGLRHLHRQHSNNAKFVDLTRPEKFSFKFVDLFRLQEPIQTCYSFTCWAVLV